jgi:GDP-D-mannose dehydratase
MTTNYRETYGMFAFNGILFKHEWAGRAENVVTRRATRGLAGVHTRGNRPGLEYFDARLEWEHQCDLVQAMRLMLQPENHDDFVIATGVIGSTRELLDVVFGLVRRDYRSGATPTPRTCDRRGVGVGSPTPTKGANTDGLRTIHLFARLIPDMLQVDLDVTGVGPNIALPSVA